MFRNSQLTDSMYWANWQLDVKLLSESWLWQCKWSFNWQYKLKCLDVRFYDCWWWFTLFGALVAETVTNQKMVPFCVRKGSTKQFNIFMLWSQWGHMWVKQQGTVTEHLTWAMGSSGRNNPTEICLRTSKWRCIVTLLTFIYLYMLPASELSKIWNVHLMAFTYMTYTICFWLATGCASIS
jgi:hypothetical protein